jgi:hypothetical protein
VKLEQARLTYINRCSGCHNLIRPADHSLDQWETLLDKMAPKSRLGPNEKEMIWMYLVTVKREEASQ